MVGGPLAAAETTAKPKWAVKTGPGATSGTAAKALWKLVSQPSHWWKLVSGLGLRPVESSGHEASVRKTIVLSRDSDGAFGSKSHPSNASRGLWPLLSSAAASRPA